MKSKIIRHKLIYVGFSFIQHGAQSGYDYIKNVLHYDKFIDCQNGINYLNSIPRRKNILLKIYLILFGDRPWWVEFRCILYALFNRHIVFHFIYPEQLYRYTGIFKGKTNKIVCTLHQPAKTYKDRPDLLTGSRYIDKIIVMSSDMLNPLQEVFKDSKLLYIPHGVNTSYFKPLFKKREKKILMVGSWKRNFDFANAVFMQILNLHDDVAIDVVSSKENHRYFTLNSRLNLLSGIRNDELLDLYQSSSVLFLPLNSFTANNALLEGAACGCRIVIATNQQTDSCYIKEEFIDLVPLDIELSVNILMKALNNPDENDRENIAEFVRKNYDWKIIGELTEKAIFDNLN
jgi:glycosyltransferase involved in cell wall biosynthesis